jgi:hypothetical protein
MPKMMTRVLDAEWKINSFFIGLNVYFELGMDQSTSQFIKNNQTNAKMMNLYIQKSLS